MSVGPVDCTQLVRNPTFRHLAKPRRKTVKRLIDKVGQQSLREYEYHELRECQATLSKVENEASDGGVLLQPAGVKKPGAQAPG